MNPNGFEGLVDIIEDKGEPIFLFKKGGKCHIEPEVKLPDNRIVIPPPKKQIPWILPRKEEVEKYYDKAMQLFPPNLANRVLYKDLLDYYKKISDLPDEKFYDLLVSWTMYPYLL